MLYTKESFMSAIARIYRNDGAYHYIPYSYESRVFSLIKKRAKATESFCDAGCGFPVFPLLALQNGFRTAVGIENFPMYIDMLKPQFGEMIIDEDIMNHNYSDYDVIYAYSPTWGSAMLKFIAKVKSEMKKGSLFVVTGLSSTLTELEYKNRGLTRDREFKIDYFIK